MSQTTTPSLPGSDSWSSVFPENTVSVRVHLNAGFRLVGARERIACHHGRWRDTVLLERRSKITGVS